MRRILSAILLWIPAAAAHAFSPATQATMASAPEALYDLDYAESRSRFHRLIEVEPNNPFGYLFEAGAIWWESSNEYGLFKDTPTLENLFEYDVQQALAKATAYQKSSDPRVKAEGFFVGGMALGTRGQWNLLRGKWVKAYFDGKKAIKDLNKVLKYDPEFYDVYLGLGVYDYQADRLPGILKLSALFMVHGDAKRGLERIELAIDKGRFISGQAAQFLATIYIQDEKNYPSAIRLIRLLQAKYPRSAYFDFLAVTTLARMGDFDGSYRAALQLFGKVQVDPEILGRKQLSILCGMDGPDCFNPAELAAVIQWLNRAVEAAEATPDVPPDWRTFLHFYRGVAYDLSNQHAQAINDYENVLAAEPFEDLAERAKACLMNHCERQEILRTLKALSLESNPPPPAVPQPSTASTPSGREDRE